MGSPRYSKTLQGEFVRPLSPLIIFHSDFSLSLSPVGQSVPFHQLFTQRWCLTPCYSECGLQTIITGIICVGKKCRLSDYPQSEHIRAFILTRSPCNSNPQEILRSVGLVTVFQTPKKLVNVEYFLGLGLFPSPSHSKFSSVQLSRVRLFVAPWAAAHQASLSITNSRNLLKLMSIKSVILSNHLILCRPFSSWLQYFPASESFQMNQLFASSGQSMGVSAPASVLPVNIQD